MLFAAPWSLATKLQPAERPNILLIVSEDNGAELGCYGDPYASTPRLDKLAARGCRFANAYVTQAVCSASRASIYTGFFPFQNGQIGLATHRYAMFRPWDNLASLLRQHGYRTGMIGKLHVNPESAFPLDYRAITQNGFSDRPMTKYAAAAATFFQSTSKPFFLAINFPDAHFPLIRKQHGLPENPIDAAVAKPLPFIGIDSPRLREGAANYYNCLSRLDTGVGMVLDELEASGKRDDTLIVYIGDHGAQFSRGKGTCYEGGLRIPMILDWPSQVEQGIVRDELVSTVDLLPTVLQATKLPARKSLPGHSLLPLAAGCKVPWRKYLFAERTAYHAGSFFPQRTLRDSRFKVIVNLTPERSNPVAETYRTQAGPFFIYGTNQKEIDTARPEVKASYSRWKNSPAVELYDLKKDPWEFDDLSLDEQLTEVKQRLLRELEQFRQRYDDPLLDPDKLVLLANEHDQIHAIRQGGRLGKEASWQYIYYLLAPSTAPHPKEDH